jgi:hypothetical protein
LRSSHDDALGHHRRYSPSQLLSLARKAGLAPLRKGELFASLLLPRALSVVRERVVGRNGGKPNLHWEHGEIAARIVTTALAVDAGICRTAASLGVPLAGLSTWVLCEPR